MLQNIAKYFKRDFLTYSDLRCHNVILTQKAFKYRFHPTQSQETLLRKTMGCARLVCNRALAARAEAWYARKERVGYSEISTMLKLPEGTEPSTITVKLSSSGRWTVSLNVRE
jgi:putative transposase